MILQQILWAAAAVVVIGAAVKVCVSLLSSARGAARQLDAIERLTSRELQGHKGASMKDDIHGIAVAIGDVQRRQDMYERILRRKFPAEPEWRELPR